MGKARRRLTGILRGSFAVTALLAGAGSAQAGMILIDEFSVEDPAQDYAITSTHSSGASFVAPSVGSAASILGGERSLTVDVLSPSPGPFAATGSIGTQSGGKTAYTFMSGSSDAVAATLVYDGMTGGVDLTDGGENRVISLEFLNLDAGTDATEISVDVDLEDTAGETAEFDGWISESAAPFTEYAPFADFVTGGPFSFTSVNRIEIDFNRRDPRKGTDFELTGAVATAPEPGSMALLGIGAFGLGGAGLVRRRNRRKTKGRNG